MTNSKPKGNALTSDSKLESETTLVRFRLQTKQIAEAVGVCDELGFDLNDVLRTVVRRIAKDHAIPFEINHPTHVASNRLPFTEYGDYLDKDLAHLKAELTLSMLSTFIADRAARLREERQKPKSNNKLIQRWERELRDAVGYHRTMNTRDVALVEQVDAKFRALLVEQS